MKLLRTIAAFVFLWEAFKNHLQKTYVIFHLLVDLPSPPPTFGKFAIFLSLQNEF